MNRVSIEKIQFITPAIVTYKIDGQTHRADVGVDLRNNTVVIPPHAPVELSELFFPFLTQSLAMSASSFEADETVYEAADKANQKFEETQAEYVGGEHA